MMSSWKAFLDLPPELAKPCCELCYEVRRPREPCIEATIKDAEETRICHAFCHERRRERSRLAGSFSPPTNGGMAGEPAAIAAAAIR